MYEAHVLQEVVHTPEFAADRVRIQSALNKQRYGHPSRIDRSVTPRLKHFIECVLASAPSWSVRERTDLCRTAGEIAEFLSSDERLLGDRMRWFRLRAALLYELGDAPAVAATLLRDEDGPEPILQFFRRQGPFGELSARAAAPPDNTVDRFSLEWSAVAWDAWRVAGYLQSDSDRFSDFGASAMSTLAKSLSLFLLSTDYHAFAAVVHRRLELASRTALHGPLLDALRALTFPCELWRPQSEAIEAGLLRNDVRSWGMAAPTGTGKSFLTMVLITDALLKDPSGLVLYLVPSKALVYEVSARLSASLSKLDFQVSAVTPALVDLDDDEQQQIVDSSVLVLTPEKADLLVRLSAESFQRTCVTIVDEAHHIESGTRGILLEMYLWRLRGLLPQDARFVFLSAVAPNIDRLTRWMGTPHQSLIHPFRPTRMKVGVYRIGLLKRRRAGWIDYEGGGSLLLFEKDVETSQRRQLVQLAQALAVAGPVLVVARGKKECENLAKEMVERLEQDGRMSDNEFQSEVVQRLDSRLERELYADVPMRALIRKRVVYHHAGLPPRVRTAVEDAIRRENIRFVFATTTLAEGVNFPFSSVVVQSLALRDPPTKGQPTRYSPVTPRVFWNIAGRAGRPGVDREGQVILFEPSLGLSRVDFVINDYLNPEISSIAPVSSALANGLEEVVTSLSSGNLDESWISGPRIHENTPKQIQGTVNHVRVSLLHARAKGLLRSPEEVLEGTFASQFLDSRTRRAAEVFIDTQDSVIREFFAAPAAPSVEVAAELGLSIQTLSDLCNYAQDLEDWQLQNMSIVVRGGEINDGQINYLLSPVAARMGELEGGKLGGFFTEIVRQWILGAPFSRIARRQGQRIEDLVSVVYSRIQYLLPWGLYAFDRLVEEETERRGIPYNNAIRSVAYLVDGGVPGFDALRLTHADIERVDATRLARRYKQVGGLTSGVDVIGWLSGLSTDEVQTIVTGADNRRVDFDLSTVLGSLRAR